MGFENEQDHFAPDELHGKTVMFTCVNTGAAIDLHGGNSLSIYNIWSKLNANRYLSIGGGNDGNRVNGWEFNRSTPQQWKLEKVNPGSAWSAWTLRNVCGGSEFYQLFSVTFLIFANPSTIGRLFGPGRGKSRKLHSLAWVEHGWQREELAVVLDHPG